MTTENENTAPRPEAIADVERAVELARPDSKLRVLEAGAFRLNRLIDRGVLTHKQVWEALGDCATETKLVARYGAAHVSKVLELALRGYRTLSDESDDARGLPVDYDRRRLYMRTASEIAVEPVAWLWPARIALGKLTLIAGEPGLGKSQLCAALAAAVSAGARWPQSEARAPAGSVVIFSAEDDASDTIVPRLAAAGAELARIDIVTAVTGDGNAPRRAFSLQRDLDLLEAAIADAGDTRLVIIDPLASYLGRRIDAHSNSDVRGVLEPLAELAARYRVAVVAITHLSKGGGKPAMDRFIGSIAFVAAARAAYLVTRDPADAARRLFVPVKNNLAPLDTGLAFAIEPCAACDGVAATRIAWDGAPVTQSADDILAALAGAVDMPARAEAEDFLRRFLAEGARAAGEIERQARAAGIAWRTIKRAKTALAITTERRAGAERGDPPRWFWEMPKRRAAKVAAGKPAGPSASWRFGRGRHGRKW